MKRLTENLPMIYRSIFCVFAVARIVHALPENAARDALVAPELKDVGNGHKVACHRVAELNDLNEV